MKSPPKKRGPGRPRTTGSGSTKPVQFRVTEVQRRELEREGKRLGLTADAVAKMRVFPPATT